jgi:hypothetical protein
MRFSDRYSAQTYNPIYTEGEDQEDHDLRPVQDLISTND